LEQIEIEGNAIYWCEMRPSDKGRYVIVRYSTVDGTVDVNPTPFNARSRVHEYGGGSYKVIRDDVFFTNFADQRIYRMNLGEKPEPITRKTELRYADFEFDHIRKSIICVREDHRNRGKEAENTIVSMNLEGENVRIVAQGNDFYSSPCISPNGKYLAWLTWNHPDMPWNKTALWIGELSKDGLLDEIIQIDKNTNESILQPSWSPDNILYLVSDRNNWW
jgi:dipeptidyl aminopeptidase/acylaminoacyl peptidase